MHVNQYLKQTMGFDLEANHMLKSVDYPHQSGHAHRDLKPADFLVKLNKGKTNIKLIDFDLTEDIRKAKYVAQNIFHQIFQAPQVTHESQINDPVKNDAYSMGMSLKAVHGCPNTTLESIQ